MPESSYCLHLNANTQTTFPLSVVFGLCTIITSFLAPTASVKSLRAILNTLMSGDYMYSTTPQWRISGVLAPVAGVKQGKYTKYTTFTAHEF